MTSTFIQAAKMICFGKPASWIGTDKPSTEESQNEEQVETQGDQLAKRLWTKKFQLR